MIQLGLGIVQGRVKNDTGWEWCNTVQGVAGSAKFGHTTGQDVSMIHDRG